jgi:hypothetical protein
MLSESGDSFLTKRKICECQSHLHNAETDATFSWLADFDITNLVCRDDDFVSLNILKSEGSLS